MSRSFDLPAADWATVGTVGEPGRRTFYLQARQGGQVVTLKVEKQQVAALSEFLTDILSDLPVPQGPRVDPALIQPVEAEWAVGTLQLAYDPSTERVVILALEAVLEADEGGEEPDAATARFAVTTAVAAAVAGVGSKLVEAGRPTCPLCGRPMDPEGHACPRTNGHRP